MIKGQSPSEPIPRSIQTEIKKVVREMIDEGDSNQNIQQVVSKQFGTTLLHIIETLLTVREERAEDITIAVQRLLEARYHKTEIKRTISNQFDIAPRTVMTYLKYAKDRLIELTGRSREEHIQDAYGFYLSILKDKNNSTMARLKAAERIDKLLGLEVPTNPQMLLAQREMVVEKDGVRLTEIQQMYVEAPVELLIRARATVDEIQHHMRNGSVKRIEQEKAEEET